MPAARAPARRTRHRAPRCRRRARRQLARGRGARAPRLADCVHVFRSSRASMCGAIRRWTRPTRSGPLACASTCCRRPRSRRFAGPSAGTSTLASKRTACCGSVGERVSGKQRRGERSRDQQLVDEGTRRWRRTRSCAPGRDIEYPCYGAPSRDRAGPRERARRAGLPHADAVNPPQHSRCRPSPGW